MIEPKEIFRAYDIRGTYPTQINQGVCEALAGPIAQCFSKNATLIAGYDARKTSPELFNALIKGLRSEGISILDAGRITSPLLVFLVRSYRAQGGVIITASHNPPEYNGIKVVDQHGIAISGVQIGAHVYGKKKVARTIKKGSHLSIHQPAISRYIKFLRPLLRPKKKLKIVIDALNGAAGPIVCELLKKHPLIDLVCVRHTASGEFPSYGPDPTNQILQRRIGNLVRSKKADIGLLFDGDGDRVVIIDEEGKAIRPEYAWRLMATYLHPQKVVYTPPIAWMMRLLKKEYTSTNRSLSLTESRVGHSFIGKVMRRVRADIGVEQSGHYYFKEFFFTGSGIMAGLYAINALGQLPYPISQLSNLLPASYRKRERRVAWSGDIASLFARVRCVFKQNATFSYYDGISGWLDHGWFNVRKSNTQPIVRVNVEGDQKTVVDTIEKKLSTLWEK